MLKAIFGSSDKKGEETPVTTSKILTALRAGASKGKRKKRG